MDQIINISDPQLKDWLIMGGAFITILGRTVVWLFNRIDKNRDKEEAKDKEAEESRRKHAERLETYLSAELESSRQAVKELQNDLAISRALVASTAEESRRAKEETMRLQARLNELKAHIKKLEAEMHARAIVFVPLSEALT